MAQLLSGVAHLHSLNILHRDLKGGNLLLSNKGELKIADFGLAKTYNKYTRLTPGVVTHYYRAPELFYGSCYYNEKIDIWSIGCIFAELLLGKMLFASKTNKKLEHLNKIYELLGDPLKSWPQVTKFNLWEDLRPNKIYTNRLESHLKANCKEIDDDSIDLLQKFLAYNPEDRISAADALNHRYFFDVESLKGKKLFRDLKDKGVDFHPISYKNRKSNGEKRDYEGRRNEGRRNEGRGYEGRRNEERFRGSDKYGLGKRDNFGHFDNHKRKRTKM